MDLILKSPELKSILSCALFVTRPLGSVVMMSLASYRRFARRYEFTKRAMCAVSVYQLENISDVEQLTDLPDSPPSYVVLFRLVAGERNKDRSL